MSTSVFSPLQCALMRPAVAALASFLLSNSDVGAQTVGYSYDELGRLKTTTYNQSKTTAYSMDAAGNRVQVSTTLDTVAPSVPTGLTDVVFSSTQVNLSWAASTDNFAVASYRVYRGGSLLSIVAAPVTTYADMSVSQGSTYVYTVSAVDFAGNASAQSAPLTVPILDTIPPSAPGTPTFSSVTSNAATANWAAATDNVAVGSYEYQLNAGAWINVGNTLTTRLTGLALLTTYSFGVHAKDTNGNVGPATTGSFTTSAITDNATITVGGASTGPRGLGFSASESLGSVSPTTTSNGYTYLTVYNTDFCPTSGPQSGTCGPQGATVSIGGFTADPGSGWLISANGFNGATAQRSFAAGVTTWFWPSVYFNFPATGTTTVTLVHR